MLQWYAGAARDLPWRRPGTSPWAVLVSEVMLQQTPVARVVTAYEAWLARWPTPAALAAEPSGEAVRMWGRLGYPRRALRLHAAAVAITTEHGGQVPADVDALRALPGVGAYTAAAVASFAYGQRHAVVDTNVARVLARAFGRPPSAAADVLPVEVATAARWAAASMELGATVCTARTPRCDTCPVAAGCAWRAAGYPPEPTTRAQSYAGTDRQVRGRLLAVLREADGPVPAALLAPVWDEATQRERALAGLLADGLAVEVDGGYALPA